MTIDPFSERVKANDRIAYIDFTKDQPGAIAINDQLIVRQKDYIDPRFTPLVEGFRSTVHPKDHKPKTVHLLTLKGVFGSLLPPGIDDYVVVEVDGLYDPKEDIFELTEYLRQQTLFSGHEYDVSPNHVLMPSPAGFGCPFGTSVSGIPLGATAAAERDR